MRQIRGLHSARLCLVALVSAMLAAGCGDDPTGPVPTTGTIEVSVSSSGQDLDPDGYVVTVGAGQGQPISIDGSLTFSEVDAGSQAVGLGDVADNCSVAGTNPAAVDVVAGEAAAVSFAVTCVEITGDLEITTQTTGSDLDPDGYVVSVGGGVDQPIGADGTLLLTGLSPRDYAVELTGIAPNCAATPSSPVTVSVLASQTTQLSFQVDCAAVTGGVEVVTVTTGADQDPDGYEVTVDGGLAQPIGLNETLLLDSLPAGAREIVLSGIASNCSVVNGPDNRTVGVPSGGTVQEVFEIECAAPPSAKIVFHSDRDGDFDIYTANPDGSDVTPLTANTALDQGPAVSPDGTKIAFWSDRGGAIDIFVMNADGSDVVQLTTGGAADRYPAWSPDGARLAFARVVNTGPGCLAVTDQVCNDVIVMNADGTGAVNLTNDPAHSDRFPAWSPDGSKIAFTSDRDGDDEVYVMNANGTGPVNISNRPAARDGRPDWSPDGSRIAFDGKIYDGGSAEIWLMDPDGSNKVRLTTDASTFVDFQPRWSPDGSQLAFSSDRDGNPEVYLMEADGSQPTRVTVSAGVDGAVDWIP